MEAALSIDTTIIALDYVNVFESRRGARCRGRDCARMFQCPVVTGGTQTVIAAGTTCALIRFLDGRAPPSSS